MAEICYACRTEDATHTVGFEDREISLCCDCAEDLLNKLTNRVKVDTVYDLAELVKS